MTTAIPTAAAPNARRPTKASARLEVLDVVVDVDPPDVILSRMLGEAVRSTRTTVYYANAHVLNLAAEDVELRHALNSADIVLSDGYAIQLAARWLRFGRTERMAITDYIWSFAEACAEAALSLYIVAGAPGVAERAAAILRERYPRLDIRGTHHGYVADTDVCSALVADIHARQPDVVCVGMGTPTQEFWIERYGDELDVPLIWAVGAVMDFVSGEVRRPRPGWMCDRGLEWVTRLCADPRRMWRRYLCGHPKYLARLARQSGAAHRVARRANARPLRLSSDPRAWVTSSAGPDRRRRSTSPPQSRRSPQ